MNLNLQHDLVNINGGVNIDPHHLDITECSTQLRHSLLALKTPTDQEEVDGGVGVVPGRALQTAELQGGEVRPSTSLHQPQTVLCRDLLYKPISQAT